MAIVLYQTATYFLGQEFTANIFFITIKQFFIVSLGSLAIGVSTALFAALVSNNNNKIGFLNFLFNFHFLAI